jgi:flagellar assembly factor FliW
MVLLKLETRSFGTLEYEDHAVLELREGMLGFAQHKRYILIENEEILPFKWLQSLDDPHVSFPVIDPHLVLGSYLCSLAPEDLRSLEIAHDEDIVKLVVAVIPEDPLQTTVNLKAPIIINHKRMAGKQIVLSNSDYHTHQPLIFGSLSESDVVGD